MTKRTGYGAKVQIIVKIAKKRNASYLLLMIILGLGIGAVVQLEMSLHCLLSPWYQEILIIGSVSPLFASFFSRPKNEQRERKVTFLIKENVTSHNNKNATRKLDSRNLDLTF